MPAGSQEGASVSGTLGGVPVARAPLRSHSLPCRYLFPADKVQLADITDKTCQLAVVGPASSQALERIGITGLEGAPLGTHAHFSVSRLCLPYCAELYRIILYRVILYWMLCTVLSCTVQYSTVQYCTILT